ncbi:MAG TPA: hypothetical protein DEQ68_00195 [Ruminococcaceae bacterium]|nr:hypothetical protein [Oscillospiraceae bacterium]
MKNIKKAIGAAFLAVLLAGCSKIADYSGISQSSGESVSSDVSSDENSHASDTFTVGDYTIVKQNFLAKLNAEGGVYEDATARTDGDFDGKGFLAFKEGGRLTHIVNANTPQFYRIIISARSEKGASIKLYVKKKAEGVFYVPAAAENDEGFGYCAVDSIYLTSGSNALDFVVESGTCDIDYILVENSDAVSSDIYRTGTSSANPSASLETVGVMKYLSEIYGNGVLAAANVTLGTNAEIDAVFKAAGRYPAIRTSELAGAVLDSESAAVKLEKDIALALDWGKNGGLVSYKWHWYSPNTKRSVDSGAFDMEEALSPKNLDEVALMTADELKLMVENGFLSANTISLLNDIDKIADILAKFAEEKQVVLFEPVPNADSGLYWWGDSAEYHQKLYRLIFDRLCRYHKLSNIVWIWSGSSVDYYPGARYCDIIGQSIFENSNSTFAARLSSISENLGIRKPICATSRDVLPAVDLIRRDNAMWLWNALESGKYVVRENGTLSTEYNSLSSINNAYNSSLFITRDELPDLKNYALGE